MASGVKGLDRLPFQVVPPDPPDPSDHKALDRLQKALDTNGYDVAHLRHLMPKDAHGAYLDGWSNPALRRTEPTTPLSTLTRLFALGLDVPASDLDEVTGLDVSDCIATGLVAVRRRTAHPLVSTQPVRMGGVELRVVSEAPQLGVRLPAFPEFVPGVVDASNQLAKLTIRRRFGRALDMGTGNGFQALLASRHCDEVVATDLNRRALAFARFNMAWNRVENVDLRQGDRYEPVSGELFDLILSNPPFVVSPATTVQYRDSGLPTDTISETTVTGAAEHLTPGGWAQIMCQWVHHDGERWQDRVEAWVAGTGCDAWAVQRGTQDSVSHAVQWLTELGRADPKEADRQFEQWMDYFDSEDVAGVGTGFVVLRKAVGRDPWYIASELGEEWADDAGEAVASFFDTQDWLHANPGAGAILDTHWRLAEHVRLDTTQGGSNQGATANRHVLRQGTGLRTSVEITKDLAEIVMRCDGTRPLRAVVGEHLKGRWRDPARHEAEIEVAFRQLVAPGFVVSVTETR